MQEIGIGTGPTNAFGDDTATAYMKINANFKELSEGLESLKSRCSGKPDLEERVEKLEKAIEKMTEAAEKKEPEEESPPEKAPVSKPKESKVVK